MLGFQDVNLYSKTNVPYEIIEVETVGVTTVPQRGAVGVGALGETTNACLVRV